ncbi:hypothetical protein NDU88_006218 [Pleurodeles waltl]|uniref:Uncharacterized protein n=1 Tax=Pleurodeles waltl TaxID=8319 RepID=A0AAV7WE20_PLEWA|nr:hypothetical protein NDU88_006218 [Pleurodeles waltl]
MRVQISSRPPPCASPALGWCVVRGLLHPGLHPLLIRRTKQASVVSGPAAGALGRCTAGARGVSPAHNPAFSSMSPGGVGSSAGLGAEAGKDPAL